ncbi:MAG: proton-conducting transporter membrane subunit [Desulfurococcaceae archaeon]
MWGGIAPLAMTIGTLAIFAADAARLRGRQYVRAAGYGVVALAVATSFAANLIDSVSFVLAIASAFLAAAIGAYSQLYIEAEGYSRSIELFVDAYATLLLLAFASPSLMALLSCWAAAEVVAFVLVRAGEERATEGPLTSSRGFVLTSTMTFEATMFTLMFVLAATFVSASGLSAALRPFSAPAPRVRVPAYLMPLLFAAFVTKAALFPLHFWLPGAHASAPAPASALLSGASTVLGLYGLYRLTEIVDFSGYAVPASALLIAMGTASVVLAGIKQPYLRDGKQMLAYGTIATNGFSAALLAAYLVNQDMSSLAAFVSSLLLQMSYKTTLFCYVGLLELEYGTRYVHGLKGAAELMPVSSIGGALSAFALLGVPGTVGFVSKALALYVALASALATPWLGGALLAVVATYLIYSAQLALSFIGTLTPGTRPLEPIAAAGAGLQDPVLALGLSSILFTFLVPLWALSTGLVLAFVMPAPLSALLALLTTWAFSRRRAQRGMP